ncbi:MAG: hypothetical protein WCG45_04460 [bacterium]
MSEILFLFSDELIVSSLFIKQNLITKLIKFCQNYNICFEMVNVNNEYTRLNLISRNISKLPTILINDEKIEGVANITTYINSLYIPDEKTVSKIEQTAIFKYIHPSKLKNEKLDQYNIIFADAEIIILDENIHLINIIDNNYNLIVPSLFKNNKCLIISENPLLKSIIKTLYDTIILKHNFNDVCKKYKINIDIKKQLQEII